MVQRNGVRGRGEAKEAERQRNESSLGSYRFANESEANKWLQLNPRITALDVFERGPTMIAKIHAYLVRELILAEKEGEKSAEFIDRMCQITLTRGILDAEH